MDVVESSDQNCVEHLCILLTIFLKLLTCILTHMHVGRGRISLIGTFDGAFSKGEKIVFSSFFAYWCIFN